MDKLKFTAFDRVIGQGRAVELLKDSLGSSANDGPMLSPLLLGEQGNGKTCLAKAYCDVAEEELDLPVKRFGDPDEFKYELEAGELIEWFQDTPKGICWIDEIHKLTPNSGALVGTKRVYGMIHAMLDGNRHGQIIPVTSQWNVVFRPEKFSIVGTTNMPNKMGGAGAFASRFDKMELDLYSEEELIEILGIMMSAKDFKIPCDKTLAMIARCGRGTARPMEKIVKQLIVSHSASGKTQRSFNREEVLSALLKKRMYPRGLQLHEVEMLAMANESKNDMTILAKLPKLERAALRDSKGYLLSCDFVHATRGGIKRTDKGGRYLEAIKKDRFPVPTF